MKWKALIEHFFRRGHVLGKSVLDIGSNAGLYSLTAWIYGGASSVTLYEPDTRFHEVYEGYKDFFFNTNGA